MTSNTLSFIGDMFRSIGGSRRRKEIEKATKDVPPINPFPEIDKIVLKYYGRLFVFSPEYLLAKHGKNAQVIGSRFLNIENKSELTKFLLETIKRNKRKIKKGRVELKNQKLDGDYAENSVVNIASYLKQHPEAQVEIEEIKRPDANGVLQVVAKKNIIKIKKEYLPRTKIYQVILIPYDKKFVEPGREKMPKVHELFKKRRRWFDFIYFQSVHTIVTVYPGMYAPPFEKTSFWKKHAFLVPELTSEN